MQKRKILKISGMTCASCEMRIENKLNKLNGVFSAEASFGSGVVKVLYEDESITLDEIVGKIESLDYKVVISDSKYGQSQKSENKLNITGFIGIGIIIFALYLIIKNTIGFDFLPTISQNMSYGILFVIGLITSLHCLAMCGGINLSQCVTYNTNTSDDDSKLAKLKPSFLYNAGRVTSYTIIGGIVGAIGSVLTLSGTFEGLISILAGIFMVIMGLNMLNIFPALRKFMPRMPKIFGNKIHNNGNTMSPYVVGLLNGLMPCGPLQSMQIYALGTGSFTNGALSMFVFSLGTVPLMFGFGAVSSLLSSKFTKNMMKVSASLVMILGVIMLTRGFSLSGIDVMSIVGLTPKTVSAENQAVISGNVQNITAKMSSNAYPSIVVQKGVPVKFTIQADAKDLNGCDNVVQIQKYGIKQKLVVGDNVIEFTPTESGSIPYSCWMGMVNGKITVVDNLSDKTAVANANADTNQNSNNSAGILNGANNGNATANTSQTAVVATINGNTQSVIGNMTATSYPVIIVQKGIPVKFTIHADASDLNSCGSYVLMQKYGIQKELKPGDNVFEFTPKDTGSFQYSCSMNMILGNISVVDDINDKTEVANASKSGISSIANSTGGGCCGGGGGGTGNSVGSAPQAPVPPAFADGAIPTDIVQVAKTDDNGVEQLNVTVDNNGYLPAVFVVQKGAKFKINFVTVQLNTSNYAVQFPTYNGGMYLNQQTATPELTATNDFGFESGDGTLHAFVKVVDDINKVDINSVKNDAKNYK